MIQVSKSAIEGAAILTSKVINSKNALPILGNILCEVADNKLTMTGSDSECSISTTIELDAMAGEGRFCVDAGRLVAALREIPEHPLSITCTTESDYMFTIEHQDGQAHFIAENADEYPLLSVPDKWEHDYELMGDRIGEAIKSCLWAMCTDDLRPAMCGVHICTVAKHDALDIVASDGTKLVRNRLTTPNIDTSSKLSATITAKAAKILADTLTEADTIAMRFGLGMCQVETDRYTMTFRLIDAPYPKYNSVIPADNNIVATVDRSDLKAAIKRVLPFASNASQLIQLHFDEAQLTVFGDDFDFSAGARNKLSVEYNSSEPLTVGVKGSTLLKALGYILNIEVAIKMSDPTRAILIEPKLQPMTECTILLMPLLIND